MNKKIINSIQIQSKKLTKKKYSKKYIITYILPIIEYIVSSKKTNFLISGSQGSGKTTLIKILEKNINLFYNKKILTLSLDDYYLSKKERISLSKKKHDLFFFPLWRWSISVHARNWQGEEREKSRETGGEADQWGCGDE